MTVRRVAFTAAAAATLIAFAGCGSGESKQATLGKQDQQQLAQQTTKLQQSLQTTVAEMTKCIQGSIKSGGIAALSACAEQILTKAAAASQELSTYVTGLKGKVKDKCGTELQAMADAVKQVGTSMKTAADAIGKGNVASFQSAISGLSGAGNKVQGAVSAVGTACTG